MREFFQSLRSLLLFSVLLGLIYPFAMTFLSQRFFYSKANGSLIEKDKKIIGSELIAQKFTRSEYFWPRPSAGDYNANPSGASNLGPTSLDLKSQIVTRRKDLAKSLEVEESQIPQDLLTTSGSGLDPHVSPEGAKIQISRIVKSRKWPLEATERLNTLVDTLTEQPTLGILGERRVNILRLNLALEDLKIGSP